MSQSVPSLIWNNWYSLRICFSGPCVSLLAHNSLLSYQCQVLVSHRSDKYILLINTFRLTAHIRSRPRESYRWWLYGLDSTQSFLPGYAISCVFIKISVYICICICIHIYSVKKFGNACSLVIYVRVYIRPFVKPLELHCFFSEYGLSNFYCKESE